MRLSAYEEHALAHSDAKPFKCEQCPYAAKREKELRIHRRSHDDKREKHACPVCNMKLSSKGGLKSHLIRHTGGGKHKCSLCSKTFVFLSQLKHHIAFVHEKTDVPAKGFKCDLCERAFNCNALLALHMTQRHSDERKFKCSFCDKKFKCEYSLNGHEKKVHLGQGRTSTCADCGKRFLSKSDLQKHMEVHKPESERTRYGCDMCEKTFAFKGGLSHHMKVHKTEKQYKCLQCEKAFHYKSKLERHELVHLDTRPFRCTLCEKAFKTQDYLNIHMERHGNKRNFKCAKCSATFKASTDLSEHMRRHRSGKEYACGQCGDRFKTPKYLKQHMFVHSDVRDFACRHCSYTAKTKYILEKHEETHLAPEHRQQFSCSQCDRTFFSRTTLRVHVESAHSQSPSNFRCEKCQKVFTSFGSFKGHQKRNCQRERKFVCEVCGMSFKDRSNLKRHMTVHSDARPFHCHVCSASYRSVEGLRYHSKRHLWHPHHWAHMPIAGAMSAHRVPKTPSVGGDGCRPRQVSASMAWLRW